MHRVAKIFSVHKVTLSIHLLNLLCKLDYFTHFTQKYFGNESGRENEIRELLLEQEWIQQTVDILRDN